AIGASGLLCRVGLYYHDVGKMLKPHYFVENQPDGRNPHDKLKPHTSAAIVKEHVVEGEKMARDEGVPDVVARFIPVFEMITGITTDQTLLEWGDPNRPLLRRLSMEAPGTYAHTINVANLAEAAASAIGASGLLCRVGLYYHDVGKMLKPHYFVENQPDGRNPHDRLKPDTSAAIVREHVTEGLKLAREENVPDVIADFILEHHGTQRIGFFWERAVEEYGEDSLDPDDYRYPGPRPRSRETAIAMLADSVESATRAMQDPTAERIRDLIDSVVDGKVAAGQLDDAPLTLREITRIKDQFVKALSGVHHHRIEYPETRHLTESPAGGGGGHRPPGPDAKQGA
ncbi:MAG TPA: HDIG domain-containing protein, partial [Longimicrobiales bacterium]|nr:HDIG domain-containing protein [Longimicrobiales bacterium]